MSPNPAVSLLATPPLAPDGAGRLAERLAVLRGMLPTLHAVDEARPAVLAAFGGLTVAVLLLALVAARLHEGPARRMAAKAASVAFLLVLAVPPASTLMFAVRSRPATPGSAAGLLAVTTFALWAAALAVRAVKGTRTSLLWLSAGTALTLLADQILGGPMTYAGFLSYSPLASKRFYGLGNEGASILVGSALLALALAADRRPGEPRGQDASRARVWAPAITGIAVVLVSAAPTLGANVTVLLWGTATFGLYGLIVNGRRVGWREALIGIAAVAVAVAGLVAVDLLAGSRTHLALAWKALASGELRPLAEMAGRKAAISGRILAQPASLAALLLVAALAYARSRPGKLLGSLFTDYPGLGAAVWAALGGAALAMLTEDSGVVIVALLVAYPGIAVLAALLEPAAGGREAAEG